MAKKNWLEILDRCNRPKIKPPNRDEQAMLEEHRIPPSVTQKVTIKGKVYCAREREGQGNRVSCSVEACTVEAGMVSVKGEGESFEDAIESLKLATADVAKTNCKRCRPRLTYINRKTERTTTPNICPLGVEPNGC